MKLKNSVLVGLLASLFLFAGCGDKGDTIIQGGNAQLERFFIEVGAKDWKWNDNAKRYEVFYETDRIDKDIYDLDAVIGYVFTLEDGVEVVKNLPFEREYKEPNNYVYSERISYDIEPGYIAFYIENSDKIGRAESLVYYEFKIIIVTEK